MPNTWFKHDVNSAIKSELTLLIEVGGAAAYGRFWMLVEYAYMMQQTRKDIQDTFTIPQTRLAVVLNTKTERVWDTLKLFKDILGVEFTPTSTQNGVRNIKLVTLKLPKLLNYIGSNAPKRREDNNRKEKNRKYKPVAEFLRDLILKHIPDRLISKDDIDNWSNDVRLMVEQDKRTLKQIQDLMEWVFSPASKNGNFWWADNILSMGKFRSQWKDGKISLNKIKPQKTVIL